MIMKTILKITMVLSLMLLMVSCHTDLLNPVPKTSMSDLSVFDNADRILAQVNGLYDYCKDGQFLGGRFFIYNDIRAENFRNLLSNGVTGYSTWSFTVVSTTNEVQNLWGAVYAAVNQINVFMDNLKSYWDAGSLNGIIDEDTYNQYMSEALTLRALCYFDLLQLYAQPYNKDNGASLGVPLRLKGQKSSADNALVRSTVAEVYAQILTDLDTAEGLAIMDYDDSQLNTTRIHRNTIVALKTRVYLHMNNWSKLITEAQKIVNASFEASTGVANALDATVAEVFASPYDSPESIFSMPFTSDDLPGTQNGLADYYVSGKYGGNGDYSINTVDSWAIYNNAAFASTDARRAFFRADPDALIYLIKFPTEPISTDYAPVIRYAEVLLNYAEALAHSGSSVTQAEVDLLNAIRGRSNPTGTYNVSDFATVDAFLAALQTERDIEFLGEGIRNMDIMRHVATIPAKYSVSAILPSQSEYIWPIPSTELDSNPLCEPNE